MSFGQKAILWLALAGWLAGAAGVWAASDLPSSPFGSPASAPSSAASRPAPASQPAKPRVSPPPLPIHRLSESQINLLKVYEIDLSAKPPVRVEVPPQVMEAIFRDYADRPESPKGRLEQERWRAKSDLEQLGLLFRLKARDLYGQVTVYGHPASMDRFRLKIHRDLVLNYCGTSQCHGGVRWDKKSSEPGATKAVGGFFLFRKNPTDDVTAYTNYLLLTRYADPASGQAMIHHNQPELSLLLQYALAWEEASYRHPKSHGWRPYFASTKSSDFQMVVQWIKMLQSRSYPIDYELKFESAVPASQPDRPSATSQPAAGN